MSIIKLTSKDNYQIAPNAMGAVEVNETITIPEGYVGLTTNRLSMVKSCLHIPNGILHSGWSGKPVITILNSGVKMSEVRKNDELCEILLVKME